MGSVKLIAIGGGHDTRVNVKRVTSAIDVMVRVESLIADDASLLKGVFKDSEYHVFFLLFFRCNLMSHVVPRGLPSRRQLGISVRHVGFMRPLKLLCIEATGGSYRSIFLYPYIKQTMNVNKCISPVTHSG